ncbi:uncharacterized protein E0L32_012154 [Thyridium curvatum]|uniref:LPXTG-motif cell wall anchor domain protein n=1 Tax=Thyridium curvatum TaxID=1093900 RepID=A0A507BL27_9PEZI|nr:uncharacterized protein E0L32_012154 [Thyridium curvatum]TPX17368.1 hypothetical protein E0L32_012154 [Thyridium curvatum]
MNSTSSTSTVAPETGQPPNRTAASADASASSAPEPCAHGHYQSPRDSGLISDAVTTTTTTTTAGNKARERDTHHTTHRQHHNSSKLPAFRFADLKRETLALPALLQHQMPPSPVSPDPDHLQTSNDPTELPQPDLHQVQQSHQGQTGQTNPVSTATQRQRQTPAEHLPPPTHHPYHHHQPQQSTPAAASPPSAPVTSTSAAESSGSSSAPSSARTSASLNPPTSPGRSRASSDQTPATSTQITPSATAATTPRRPASYPDSPSKDRDQQANASAAPSSSTIIARSKQRRAPASFSSDGHEPRPNANTPAIIRRSSAGTPSTKDWAQGQRELLLPKSLQDKPADDKKKPTSRPPVSFRPPRNDGSSGRTAIPPIRSFRSSGSRKSLQLDMNLRGLRDESDDASEADQHDRTLRALEGRSDDHYSQMTPPDSAGVAPEENTGDLFMRIAGEESTRRAPEPARPVEEQTAATRLIRSTQRRPLSAAIPSYQAASPPQIPRRLSDQRENSRASTQRDVAPAQQSTRELARRAVSRIETPRTARSVVSSARPSPSTPRSAGFHDSPVDNMSTYARRRSSVTEGGSWVPGRSSSHRTPYGFAKNYNSSPLVPRSADPTKLDAHDGHHGREGTESTASTAAPSTVWDELDDLKSRLHRLELTGKLPPTSGAAMSRASDDRPATATTNATTLSGSPKRTSGGQAQAEAASTTSSQRESQPILISALSKVKTHLNADVYGAIESAATEALSLSHMMGGVGQPGPISSGASTIGVGGTATVTDRQLRRKAESICRSLTELCLALSDEAAQKKTPQVSTPREKEGTPLLSPTLNKTFAGLPPVRRPPQPTELAIPKSATSPRAATRVEDRRSSLLMSPAIATPRFALSPNAPSEAAGRRSSLLVSRTRRAGTEEPEEQSGRKSTFLRTRRAGTEEPEEGRKSSLLLRPRKGTNDDDDDGSRFRAPSRAATEVAGLRTVPREQPAQQPMPSIETASPSASALPRRRLLSSTITSRLALPSISSQRRFLDRSTPERDTNSVVEKLAEDRGQRQFSLGQTAMLNRTSSISRRRESAIPSLSGTASQLGSHR